MSYNHCKLNKLCNNYPNCPRNKWDCLIYQEIRRFVKEIMIEDDREFAEDDE